MSITKRIFLVLAMCLMAVPVAQAASSADESKQLNPIHAAVKKVVEKGYQDSADYLFGRTAHFEQNTIPYVLEAMVKVPVGVDPGLEVVRGPRAGGYWLEVELRDGFNPYPRAEGKSDRGAFLEYVYYPQLKGGKQHLYIVLRIPKDDKRATALHDELLNAVKEFTMPAAG